MSRAGRVRMRTACALCVALAPALASADGASPARTSPTASAISASEGTKRGCTLEDALASQRAPATPVDSAPADAAVAAEAARTLPPVDAPEFVPVDVADHHVPLPADLPRVDAPQSLSQMPVRNAPLRFFDRDSLRAQIKSIRRLPLVRLFDNRQMSIYLGVDRKGVAGLHLQQRRPDDADTWMRPAAAPVDIPLRSVPIETR